MDWVTSSNITMDAGTEWTFSLANVTNDATAGIEIVNWQTMTNYVALNPADPPVTNNTTEVFNQMVTFPSITVAGQLIDGSVSTISVANVSLDVDWLPTATVDIGSEGLPLDALYVNDATSGKQAVNWQTMTGYADSIQTNQEAVAFSASSEEDWAHTNLAYDAFDVVRGRLWVSDTNNSPVDVTATLSLYMDSDRHGEDVIYRADIDLIQVLASGSSTAPTNTITVDDASSFAVNQLVVIYDADSTEYARIESINSNDLTFEDDLQSDVDDDAGVSRVGEYGGFSLYGTNNTVWARVSFSSNQTVNIANWLEYKK